jgi:peptide chain release factor 2
LNESAANDKNRELKNLKNETAKYDELSEIAEIASDDELKSLEPEIIELEKLTLFSGKYDEHNAIINFYAGAGGDDAQDWNEMLLRMYTRWAEDNSYSINIIDETKGGEAGIKSATLEIKGSYAYGKLRGESGVHRLVRQSPFNAKALRQTSFALVQVMPEIEKESEIEIDPKAIRVDVFRSGGHGGQSVNTTDSAVRITHLPTGIVVTCQNERSQLQNKETVMKVLRSRLAQLMLEQHKEKVEELKGNFSSPEWGNQIRSYVLHPYKLVKDHRTEHESTNPDQVLSGDIDGFIDAELRAFKSECKKVS